MLVGEHLGLHSTTEPSRARMASAPVEHTCLISEPVESSPMDSSAPGPPLTCRLSTTVMSSVLESPRRSKLDRSAETVRFRIQNSAEERLESITSIRRSRSWARTLRPTTIFVPSSRRNSMGSAWSGESRIWSTPTTSMLCGVLAEIKNRTFRSSFSSTSLRSTVRRPSRRLTRAVSSILSASPNPAEIETTWGLSSSVEGITLILPVDRLAPTKTMLMMRSSNSNTTLSGPPEHEKLQTGSRAVAAARIRFLISYQPPTLPSST